jgi:hypothetical protein
MICNSGGAIGADSVFENECLENNIKVIAWSFKGHNIKSKNVQILTKEQLDEGFEHIKIANKSLKRNIYNLNYYIKNLLSRNWYQVVNSDNIYAIAHLDKNFKIASGGTGWAVQCGIDNQKVVYVFDSNYHSWFLYNYDKNIFEKYNNTPVLSEKFAGIGSREIDEESILEIKKLIRIK